MEWSRKWSFWRREESAALGARARKRIGSPPARAEEWEARLVEEGVSKDWAPTLATKLMQLAEDGERDALSASALIRGAAVAVEVQADVQAGVERNMRDVREVERLLGAFSGELEKLDEVLEVLAAYAQRMRTKPGRASRRVLH